MKIGRPLNILLKIGLILICPFKLISWGIYCVNIYNTKQLCIIVRQDFKDSFFSQKYLLLLYISRWLSVRLSVRNYRFKIEGWKFYWWFCPPKISFKEINYLFYISSQCFVILQDDFLSLSLLIFFNVHILTAFGDNRPSFYLDMFLGGLGWSHKLVKRNLINTLSNAILIFKGYILRFNDVFIMIHKYFPLVNHDFYVSLKM